MAAKQHPGGWVHEVDGGFGAGGAAPPEAIIGSWKVDDHGNIVGEFVPNPRYDPSKWPPAPSLNQTTGSRPPPLILKR